MMHIRGWEQRSYRGLRFCKDSLPWVDLAHAAGKRWGNAWEKEQDKRFTRKITQTTWETPVADGPTK